MSTEAQRKASVIACRKWRLKNLSKVAAYARQWRKDNPDKYLANSKRTQDKNRTSQNAARRKRRAINPEPFRASCRKAARKRVANAKTRDYARTRYHRDPSFKLMVNLRNRIRCALKSKTKGARTKELLGCPVVWLEAWLESLFRPGMTWANHGPVWEIDHIRPCASFDLRCFKQQKICFHWTNQQPLFKSENSIKGAKY